MRVDMSQTADSPPVRRKRVAIVTGASGWIGSAVAPQLADLGYHLVLLGRREEKLIALREQIDSFATHTPTVLTADLTDYDAIQRIVVPTVAELGIPEVLVNTAGGWSGSHFGSFLSKDGVDLRAEIDDNLLTAVFMSRAFLPAMVENRYGRIINVSSIAGIIALEGHSAYSAAKAGHSGLARQLAVEFGPMGITTNCVAPGAVLTPRAAELLAASDVSLNTMLQMTPSGRLTTPDEVAELVLFLASVDAAQINGQTIAIDGGMTSA
ncbi:SDR family NAD(P)-dependent oxidoreductase [Nocardia sp. CA-290969]|uniref:SDR family NAD(P)-dependent oxidoreductase n=1 Tax=Nocardia sp. CA-290969 TaxID=3239986 RepID=UPI003D9467B5